MKLLVLIVRIAIILIFLSIISFSSNINDEIVNYASNTFSLEKNNNNKYIVTLIIHLILGGISLFTVLKDNKYFEENFEISFFRKFSATFFRLICFVTLFFILFSLYMLIIK